MVAKKRFNSTVRNVKTFRKKQVKIGRTLRHDNATDTRVRVKKIGILEQLREEGEEAANGTAKAAEFRHPQKGLDELVPQLGHYNENICRDAIHGARFLFKNDPEQLRRHLRRVIPAIGSLIIRELKSTGTRNQLKLLIELVCEVPEEVLRSHFALLCGFVLAGISDVRAQIRSLCFEILTLLLRKYVSLCRKSRELFDAFLQLMDGQRKPENRIKLLDSLSQFVAVFGDESNGGDEHKLWPERTVNISFENGQQAQIGLPGPPSLLPSPASLHFPVLCPSDSGSTMDGTSPLMTRDGMVNCCRVFCPLLEAIIRAERDADGTKFTSTMSKAHNILSRLVDVSLRVIALQFDGTDEFRCQIIAIFDPLRRCPLTGASKKLTKKLNMLNKD